MQPVYEVDSAQRSVQHQFTGNEQQFSSPSHMGARGANQGVPQQGFPGSQSQYQGQQNMGVQQPQGQNQ